MDRLYKYQVFDPKKKMSDLREKQHSLLAEMRRRRVFRTVIAYSIFSWIVVQVADVLLPAFGGPNWGVRAITTALVVGFPMVLILSWLFDLGDDGISRVETDGNSVQLRATHWFRLLVVVPTLLATAAAVWYLWTTDYIVKEDTSWASATKENPVIAVVPVRNLTGDSKLDWLGEGFSNLLRNHLAGSKHTIMVSDSGLEHILRGNEDQAAVNQAAAAANIDYLITGEIIRSPNGLILTERVTDLEADVDIVAQSFQELTPETIIGSVNQVARIVMQGLKLPYVQQQQSLAADFAVENIAAYEAFNAGLVYFNEFEYEDAVRSLQTALALAPDFHIARYRLAHILLSMGQEAQAIEMIESIPQDATLSRREELYIDAARAMIPRDMDTAIERYQKLLSEFPYEIDAREFLSEAYYHSYKDAEAIKQLQLIVAQEPENAHAWSALGYYQLQLGDLESARRAIDRYAELNSEHPHPWILKADLAQQEKDFATAIKHYDKALSMDDSSTLAALGAARARVALNDRAAAQEILWRIIRDEKAIHADRTDAALDLAFILRAELKYAESIVPLRELREVFQAEQILESKALATEALSLHELGQVEAAATRIDEAIERAPGQPVRYLFAKGVLELRVGKVERAQNTAKEILGYALPEEDGNQRAEKAADYLNGLVLLLAGEAGQAVELLRRAVEAPGFDYAVYELGLAQAYQQLGFIDEALAVLDDASALQFEGNAIRIEFERERRLAQRLRVEILAANGRADEADGWRDRYVTNWGAVGPGISRDGLPEFSSAK